MIFVLLKATDKLKQRLCAAQFLGAVFFNITIISAIYYSVVLIIFCRNEITTWFSFLKTVKLKPVLKSTIPSDGTQPSSYNEFNIATEEEDIRKDINKTHDENENMLRSQVHDLMEDLKIVFTESAGDKIKKPELLLKIQKKLKEYPQIKETAFEKEINSQIEFESSEQCEIILSDEELNMLWKG